MSRSTTELHKTVLTQNINSNAYGVSKKKIGNLRTTDKSENLLLRMLFIKLICKIRNFVMF